MKRVFLILQCVVLLVLISSCGRQYHYCENTAIDNETWAAGHKVPFHFAIPDTSCVYEMGLNIRYTHFYPKQNLYVFLRTVFPNETWAQDTLSIDLFTDEGIPLGKGSRVVELQHPFGCLRFPMTGDYTMTLEQAMRTDSLEGVVSVGLYITKPENIINNDK